MELCERLRGGEGREEELRMCFKCKCIAYKREPIKRCVVVTWTLVSTPPFLVLKRDERNFFQAVEGLVISAFIVPCLDSGFSERRGEGASDRVCRKRRGA